MLRYQNQQKRPEKKTIMVTRLLGEEISYSDQSPQFFKIFVPDHCSKQLRIPPAFLKYFKQDWPSKSTILSLVRGSWPVDLNKVDDNLYFQSGWEDFVQDNSLEFGDFLIFCYDGHANFYVSIFGKNRCRKEVCNAGEQCDSKRVMHSQRNFSNEPEKSEDMVSLDDTEEDDTQSPMDSRVIWSECPAFEITMRPAYLSKGLLCIPQQFARILKCRRDYVKLLHSSKELVVKLVGDFTTKLHMSKGWKDFVEENNLCLGDVCSFDLIGVENDMYVMNVSISRAGKKSPARTTMQFRLYISFLLTTMPRNIEKGRWSGYRSINGFYHTSFPANIPHFFKIILSDNLQDTGLRISKKFMREQGKNISNQVCLHVPGGRLWQIELTNTNKDEVSLKKGWHQFADHYSIRNGYFLVFGYEGNSVFSVIIFDHSATEIQYPSVETSNSRDFKKDAESNQTDDLSMRKKSPVEYILRSKKAKMNSVINSEERKPDEKFKEYYKKKTNEAIKMETIEKTCLLEARVKKVVDNMAMKKKTRRSDDHAAKCLKALQLANAFISNIKNPFFLLTLKPSYGSSRYCLNIPKSFVLRYMSKKHNHCTLQLSDGRTWPVDCNVYNEGAKLDYKWKNLLRIMV